MLEAREAGYPGHYVDALWVIVSRDLKSWFRFKVSFYTYVISCVADAALFGFMGALVAPDAPTLAVWGGDYWSFALVGLAFNHIFLSAVGMVYGSVSGMFWTGRLEHVLSSPLPVTLVVFGEVAAALVRSSLVFVAYAGVAFLFGVRLVLTPASILLAVGLTTVALFGMMGLGLISGAMFSLINAKGQTEPFQWFIRSTSNIVAGVTIPVALLPVAMQYLSLGLPQMYALDGIRRVLLKTATGEPSLLVHTWLPHLAPMAVNSLVLVVLSVFWLLVGLKVFAVSMRKAREDGNLARWS
jgi:ABC-2 type transport system permease protein